MKPIIMSTEDVRAVMDNRKTMVRMPIKPQPEFTQVHVWDGNLLYDGGNRTWCWKQHVSPDCWNEIDWLEQFAPYKPGDVLWVRETWKPEDYQLVDGIWSCAIVYKAGGVNGRVHWPEGLDSIYDLCLVWHSPVAMPREAARLFLRVKGVRVERVQDITDEGSIKEGRTGVTCDHPKWDYVFGCSDCMNSGWREPPRLEFSERWDARNANRGHGWDSNPWVWVIEFERIEKERI